MHHHEGNMNDETTKELEDLSTLACSTDDVARKRSLVAMLGRVVGRVDRCSDDVDAEFLQRDRDSWKSNAEMLARDLAEVRRELEKTRGERDTARALRSVKDAMSLETVLQCLGGVLNDMTRGGDFKEAELSAFFETAKVRLRSLAGSPGDKGRVLTEDEFAILVRTGWTLYDEHDGGVTDSFRAVLRWMEREGYLSVRLPPKG